MTTDIITNHQPPDLADSIRSILPSCESAKFAVGYFFLSGFTAIADQLDNVKELRLLIGSASSAETIEQIAEGARRLEEAQNTLESVSHPKSVITNERLQQTAVVIGETASAMNQTNENEHLILSLAKAIEEKRVKVRVYTKGRLHAKAYIFDYGQTFDAQSRPLPKKDNGSAIVGSSNLTLAGLTQNSELNVKVFGDTNHAELTEWFKRLWEDAKEFDDALMQELGQSWAMAKVTPYEVYLKALYELVKDRLEDEAQREFLWQSEITAALADFQRNAVQRAVQIIRQYNGAFVSDVVGLGKSYIGAAIVKHFERHDRSRALIICPQSLVRMWLHYNEAYELNANVLSMGMLRIDHDHPGYNILLDDERYSERDFVLIDESHNFRNLDNQRYKLLESYLQTGERRCALLTATPRNRAIWDIYNQLKLFHPGERTRIPINPPHLRNFMEAVEKGEQKAASLLSNIMVRRTRMDVLRWYGFDADTKQHIDPFNFEPYHTGEKKAYIMVGGKEQYFPKRTLRTIEYNIDDTYNGLYDQLLSHIGKPEDKILERPDQLMYARYGLWNYVKTEKKEVEPYNTLQRAGVNLRGLVRISLFKRFESSVFAFRETLKRLINGHRAFITALNLGIVPAGKFASVILLEAYDLDDDELLDLLEDVSEKYKAEDFEVARLKSDISHDLSILEQMYTLVEPITATEDDKLQVLKKWLTESKDGVPPLATKKCLIFTQYKDTATYLFDHLKGIRSGVESIFGTDKDKSVTAYRFSPKANQHMKPDKTYPEIELLIATDVMSEGLNLQDCDQIINYDLHWNPVRLIQRFGRIDRIGTEHEMIYGFNFLPEKALDKGLGLMEKLTKRVNEITTMLGSDGALLDPTEKLVDQAFYAIYQGQSVDGYDTQEDDTLVDLTEAEEFMRQLKTDNPELFEKIKNLRDGIRSAKKGEEKHSYVVCKAGNYRKIYSVDSNKNVKAEDIPLALGQMKCEPTEPAVDLPANFNNQVVEVQKEFENHIQQWQAEQRVAVTQPLSQQYILNELKEVDKEVDDPAWQGQISAFMNIFSKPLTQAVLGELRGIRREKVEGLALLDLLEKIYIRYKLGETAKDNGRNGSDQDIPIVVCSMGIT
jgi:HKD family nuclease